LNMDTYKAANDLLRSLVDLYDAGNGMSTWSISIYDTAWVSLVSQSVPEGSTRWVFPECFEFIYNAQLEDGSWRVPGCNDFDDAIINTLACLLSLKRHQRLGEDSLALTVRVEKAVRFLRGVLTEWKVVSVERIAFEMILPRLLELLEDEGIRFDIPDRDLLYDIYERKLKKVNLEGMYRPDAVRTGALHSLEAFVGKCDFDRLAHHKRNGNFFASPASTAAYLMSISEWDEEAESYLRHVIQQFKCYGYGAVSCSWPTTVMEFGWSVCNIMESGFDLKQLDQVSLAKIGNVLHSYLTAENGIIGFAPNVTPDADDTSKALATLLHIGKPFRLDDMLDAFELPSHFQCYQHERNPSVTVNCNVLMALLHYPEPDKYSKQILKASEFVLNEYWNAQKLVQDKWHISPWYPALVTTRAMTRVLYLSSQGYLKDISEALITVKIPAILFKILSCVLQTQNEDGSWGSNGNPEETADCVLSLARLASLPCASSFQSRITAAIASGRSYLEPWVSKELDATSLIWIEKVLYSIERICRSYVIAALHAPVPTYPPETLPSTSKSICFDNLFSVDEDLLTKFEK
ncbi:terpenoid cyclases/protein prenyltransferase alpha-alpha toroid, partial [Rhodocollybia butyracea]